MSAIREGEIENEAADFSLRTAGLGVIEPPVARR
jgi:hypothetical protein